MDYRRILFNTKPMIEGDDVRFVQERLIKLGYNCGNVDGYYGPSTAIGVKSFQKDKMIEVDGKVGPNTWNVLFDKLEANNNLNSSSESFLSVAQNETGYKENSDNLTKYGDWYGLNGNPWCAMFVSWCAGQAGILGTVVPKYSLCSDGAKWYQDKGRYKTGDNNYAPKPGDIIFFNRNNGINHTGIVESCSGDTVYTIEGNASDQVRRCSYKLFDKSINGYGVIKP